MNETFIIPLVRLDELTKAVDKINKRARRNGLPPVELATSAPYAHRPDGMKGTYEAVDIKISAEPVIVDGWTFVASLDHKSVPGSVIIRKSPHAEADVPERFHTCKPVCDHCGKTRRRNETFLLEKDGDYKLVGRQCVRDFIGYDPRHVASRLKDLWVLYDYRTPPRDDEFADGLRMPWVYGPHTAVETTLRVIEAWGWVSRTEAREADVFDYKPKIATADHVIELLSRPNAYNREWIAEFNAKHAPGTFDDEARDAIAWAKSLTPNGNDYLHNLHVIASLDYVAYRNMGTWCSLAVAYRKHMEREITRKQSSFVVNNEVVGTLKERLVFDVTIDSVRHLESEWGSTIFYKMHDEAGHVLVYFASRSLRYEDERRVDAGDQITLKATIKKHEVRNDVWQTVVTRGALQKHQPTS